MTGRAHGKQGWFATNATDEMQMVLPSTSAQQQINTLPAPPVPLTDSTDFTDAAR
ncbi:hypothetical protein HMPREF9136_2479 [Prevotella dentalis DSM 3688]|uniref:Uncharacterized protein n=1 Tax=Prevotella dentalis (strain ATCC 49559 / DSM 3688 / JCM 13448 / NCTC 12043 / ES 2772) TaxID=908937 RepID=F9D6K1_PREDD|nr:hypothetical protein HMPREF9136_2479 [Prevotella dentalis DSM 3688]